MTPFTQSAPPIRSAAFGSPAFYTPAGPSPHPHYHPVELSSQSPTHSSFPPLVDGFPHPFQQHHYQGTNRSTKRSLKRYYVMYRGRHRGIFHSWPLAWALTAGYHWGSLRGQVGGFGTYAKAAQAYLHHARDVDAYAAPIPGCGPLSLSLPLGTLHVEPALFYSSLFRQPHVPFPSRPLPAPVPLVPDTSYSPLASPSASSPPDLSLSIPLRPPCSHLSVSDSYTIVSATHPESFPSTIATKADVQAAIVSSLASADAKKELSTHLPHFNGDSTKFNEWFTMLTTRLSTPVWRHVHLASPSNPSYAALSQALYSVLIVALHNQACKHKPYSCGYMVTVYFIVLDPPMYTAAVTEFD